MRINIITRDNEWYGAKNKLYIISHITENVTYVYFLGYIVGYISNLQIDSARLLYRYVREKVLLPE